MCGVRVNGADAQIFTERHVANVRGVNLAFTCFYLF